MVDNSCGDAVAEAESLLNLTHLKKLFDLTAGNVQPLLESFERTARTRIDELVAAYESNNRDELIHVAHSLKGLSGNIGAAKMMDLAAQIEKEIKENADYAVSDLISKLKHCYTETIKQMNDAKF